MEENKETDKWFALAAVGTVLLLIITGTCMYQATHAEVVQESRPGWVDSVANCDSSKICTFDTEDGGYYMAVRRSLWMDNTHNMVVISNSGGTTLIPYSKVVKVNIK